MLPDLNAEDSAALEKRLVRFYMCGIGASALHVYAQLMQAARNDKQFASTVTLNYHGGKCVGLTMERRARHQVGPPPPDDEPTSHEVLTYYAAETLLDNPELLTAVFEATKGIGRYADGDGKIVTEFDPAKRRYTVELQARKAIDV